MTRDYLIRLLEFLEDQEDVQDGPAGPLPNEAMCLAQVVREELGEVSE